MTGKQQKKLEKLAPKSTKARVKAHSRTELEVTVDIPLQRRRPKALDLRIHVIYPKQLRIDPSHYARDAFFDDLIELVRLREPKYGGKTLELASEQLLDQLASDLRRGDEWVDEGNTIFRRARLFTCTFADYSSRRIEKLEKLAATEPIDHQINSFVQLSLRILTRWLNVHTEFPQKHEQTHTELCHATEYLCYTVADSLHRLAAIFPGSDSLPQALRSGLETTKTIFESQGLPWLDSNAREVDRESVVLRKRWLKRQMMGELYLNYKTSRFSIVQENVGSMIAAAMAAVWATIANVYFVRQVDFTGSSVVPGAIVFATIVIAYVLKDRIKEFGKRFFQTQIGRRIADRKRIAYLENDKKLVRKIATISEKLSYNSSAAFKQDPRLLALKHVSGSIGNGKPFHLELRRKIQPHFSGVLGGCGGLREVIRLRIDRLLPRLDEPSSSIYSLNEAGQLETISLPKNYYFFVAIRYRREGQVEFEGKEYRVTLAKTGLLRIEPFDAQSFQEVKEAAPKLPQLGTARTTPQQQIPSNL